MIAEMDSELLSLRALSTERLALFCEFASGGSIAAAVGDDLGKQTQASRWIAELEKSIGFPLTERRGRHLTVNAVGARLARILRGRFEELDEFVRKERDELVTLRIGAGNSVIEWMLAPRLGEAHTMFPRCAFDIENLRTDAILLGLNDLTLDLGVVRSEAIPSGSTKEQARGLSIGTLPFAEVHYRLFVPVGMLSKKPIPDIVQLLARLPLATSKGGHFNARLKAAAHDAGITLAVRLACASFTQAAQAVRSGAFAGILPDTATAALPAAEFRNLDITPLALPPRKLVLAWNRRLAAIRPLIGDVANLLSKTGVPSARR